MSRTVKADKLAEAINEILDAYGEHVTEGVKEATKKVANQAKKETSAKAPKQTGKYRRGWAVKDTSTRLSAESIVYNRTRYQLTHLLEKSHALRRGGRSIGKGKTDPFPHIKPAEENAVKNFEKVVKRLAEG